MVMDLSCNVSHIDILISCMFNNPTISYLLFFVLMFLGFSMSYSKCSDFRVVFFYNGYA